jgi:hypothetical protein
MPLASPLLAFAIVRLCFVQFYFENRQSVLGSRGPASSSAHTKTAIMAIDARARAARRTCRRRWCGRSSPCPMPSACSSGGGGVTLSQCRRGTRGAAAPSGTRSGRPVLSPMSALQHITNMSPKSANRPPNSRMLGPNDRRGNERGRQLRHPYFF